MSPLRPACSFGSIALLVLFTLTPAASADEQGDHGLRIDWKNNILTIRGEELPGGELKILYIEAYCRPGSTNRKWDQTVIDHKTRLIEADGDGRRLLLECALDDGVTVRHEIRAGDDAVSFDITATNPTTRPTQADWAQPCVRVDTFTGRKQSNYLGKCFIFLDGKLTRLPTKSWATQAMYTPGQVWSMRGVDRADVNPRPLNDRVPDNTEEIQRGSSLRTVGDPVAAETAIAYNHRLKLPEIIRWAILTS